MRPTATFLALACAALLVPCVARAGASRPDDSVVVIRGSSVSVERPLTPERVRDGSARVEVVRVAPAPPEPPREASEDPPVVVVVVTPPPDEPASVPAVWGWPVWPAFPCRHPSPRRFAPVGIGAFAPARNFVHGPFGHPAGGPRGG